MAAVSLGAGLVATQGFSWRKRVRYVIWFLRMSRWSNVLLLSAALYLTAVFLLFPQEAVLERLFSWRLLVAVVATGCVTAGGYIINDYFDVQIDRINRPNSLIISRRVPRRRALVLHWTLSTVGVLLGLLAGQKVGALELVAASLLYIYSAALKRSPGWGNVLVAGLTASALLVPWLLFGHARQELWIYIGFSFVISLIREIIKDAEDMRGDAAFGCKTLPIVYGLSIIRKWIYFMMGLLLVAAIVLPLLIGAYWVSAFNLFLLIPIVSFSISLKTADTRQDFRRLSRLAKTIMAIGVMSMVMA